MGTERPRVAVTGAAGFIGRALVAHLRAEDYFCRALVRKPPGTPMGDFVASGKLGPLTDIHGMLIDIDVLVHAAWPVHQRRSGSSEALAEYLQQSTETTANVARQAARAGVRRLIYLSSIKVNGEASRPGQPFRPSDVPAPVGPYAISKYKAEQVLGSIAAETGLEVVIIRPPLVYGPRVKANFRTMMVWLARGFPLPFAAVNNRRSLLALSNLVDLLTLCLTHPTAPGAVLLPADGAAVSTPQLLKALGRALGRPARLLRVPIPALRVAGDLLGRREAIDRLCDSLEIDAAPASAQLGWTPPIEMETALAATATAFLRESAKHR
jgi:nucleoside-diphosphate-sugar epimerase